MVLNPVGGIPIRDPPEVLTCVHVDGSDSAIGRLKNWQPLWSSEVTTVEDREFGVCGARGHDIVGYVDRLTRHKSL